MKGIVFVFLFFVSLSGGAQELVNHLLIARNLGEKVMHDGEALRTFGFAQSLNEQPPVPGPTLYANQGDSVSIDLFNVSQGAPHTIHLHGLDVNQENDGVPHLSFEVHHMDHGYYYFVAPHPGTYFYHCHVVSSIHVQAGMYGVFIVKPADGSNTTWEGGYEYDQDRLFTMSEMDPLWHEDSVLEHPHDTLGESHEVSIPEYQPTYFLVNGKSEQQLLESDMAFQTEKESVSFLRMANIGYLANRIVFPSALNARIVSTDGRPIPTAEVSDTLWVLPGERYGVIIEPFVDLADSISINYVNMNTHLSENIQYVPVNVSGTNSLLESIHQKELQLYPNPSSGSFVLASGQEKVYDEVRVYNALGKPIRTKELQAGNAQSEFIEFIDLPAGLYIVEVLLESQVLETLKWLVR